jgi:hypothetical protein
MALLQPAQHRRRARLWGESSHRIAAIGPRRWGHPSKLRDRDVDASHGSDSRLCGVAVQSEQIRVPIHGAVYTPSLPVLNAFTEGELLRVVSGPSTSATARSRG